MQKFGQSVILLWCLFFAQFSKAQTRDTDSLLQLLQRELDDTSRVHVLNQLSDIYQYFQPDRHLRSGNKRCFYPGAFLSQGEKR